VKTIFLAIPVCIFLASCKKFVEIPVPISQLPTSLVFTNNGTAHSALTVIYNKMYFNGEGPYLSKINGLLSDELTYYPGNVLQENSYYRNAMLPTLVSGPWSNGYSYIFQANAIMEELKKSTGVSPAVKQQLTAEAAFIRAFWHFYITNCYGDAPLVLTTDYTVNASLSRTPRVEVLKQVVADLKDAQRSLNVNYVGANDTTGIPDKVRPNKAVAQALLARAYLYLGNYSNDSKYYDSAEIQASAVIGNPLYGLSPLSGPNSVFLKNSKEAIWQLEMPVPVDYNTSDGSYFILVAAPGITGFSMSPQLFNSFETGDKRKDNWVDTITSSNPTASYYFAYKYKVRSDVTATEYTTVLRLAEQYLIRAEARVQQGNTSGAIDDINVIRSRAGLTDYAGATDKESLLDAILHERQVELFLEWGSRWFDMNRMNRTNSIMSIVTPLKGGVWSNDGHQLLYPISQSERSRGPNLSQNPGY
jgi:starch-binding outer membrane protein, SusD/RagB family